MKETETPKLLTEPPPRPLADIVLEIANRKDAPSYEELEGICEGWVKVAGDLWHPIRDPDDTEGHVSLIDLYDYAQDTLSEIVGANSAKREKIFRGLIKEVSTLGEWAILRNGAMITIPALPEIYLDKGTIRVRPKWFVTGVHAIIIYGLVGVLQQAGKLARCGSCQKFYLKTKKLRVACSDECRRQQRREEARNDMRKLRASARKRHGKSRHRRRS